MKNVLAIAFACVPLLTAADPWKGKSPSEWSDKDIQRLLTNSPWAKTTSAEMTGPMPGGGGTGRGSGMGRGGGGGGGMRSGGGGMSGGPGGAMDPSAGGVPGGGGGAGGGGMGGGGGMSGDMGGGPEAMERPQVAVRWESGEPFRQASLKAQSPHAKQVEEWSKEFYVVSASGMSMMRGGRRGAGPDQRTQPDPARMEQMQQRMKDATLLKRKGKDPLAPARVELLREPEGMTMVFLFPRTEPIDADDKELSFETAFGPMQVKSKFNLKDMVYNGKLAL